MDPDYEFLTHQWKQMISQSPPGLDIKKKLEQGSGLKGKIFDRLGDVMISGGTWFKKASRSQFGDRSVTLY